MKQKIQIPETIKSLNSKGNVHRIVLSGMLLFFIGNNSDVFGQVKTEQDTLKIDQRPSLVAPSDANNQLKSDSEDKNATVALDFIDRTVAAKEAFYQKTGFKIGFDYNSLYMGATESLGNNNHTASGIARVYGRWDLIGRGTNSTGGLVYKIEHRHAYTELTPSQLGFEIGYAGSLHPLYSDQGFRTTNLYWRQSFSKGKIVAYAGFLDSSDWTDVYALASPWESFNNLAFSVGSATIGGLPDGTLGVMASAWLTDKVYAIASITDANARATDIFKGFDTFFNDFQTFKTVELGVIKSKETAFVNNFHLTFWQIDESNYYGSPSGWGINAAATVFVGGKYEPFLRGGWAKDGGSLYQTSVSAGLGYYMGSNVLGIGLNWGQPNETTFGGKLDDQYTSEIFFRWQVAHQFQLSPSVQLVANPALNPNSDFIGVFGLRSRIFL
ncbi:carbohydrate porin [Mariniflexile maritimum]|uniref:carbohydrate porin n=1 Tax=Mariniflexile maritimum TaxID=2682493 RepID=UPI0018DD67EA|nr:carbohydrate porin [Mariniflexile maritimum]